MARKQYKVVISTKHGGTKSFMFDARTADEAERRALAEIPNYLKVDPVRVSITEIGPAATGKPMP